MLSRETSIAGIYGTLPFVAQVPKSKSSARARSANLTPSHHDMIAQRLRLTRKATGLSQAEFCRRVGIGQQAWSNYEAGRNRISIDMALRLCAGIGATLDWIYRGNMESGLPPQLTRSIQELQRRDTIAAA